MNHKSPGYPRVARIAQVTVALLAGAIAVLPIRAAPQDRPEAYASPYTVKFSHPLAELLGDIEHGERGRAEDESSVPFSEWSSPHIRKHYGSWGPPARHYPASSSAATRPVERQRERVIAVALRFLGYGYQHHHIPDWNPPNGWPWKETSVGHNGKGLDCSNFTAFVYNLALGLKPSGNVKDQSAQLEISGPGTDRVSRAVRIELPSSYADRVKLLRTGDLLFIRNTKGEISHVVLWVGEIGRSPDNSPLLIDSHGEGVHDCRGKAIPCGIYLRPFLEKSWYCRSASHAIRVLK
jgi:cell wall-associated NlpC family hydrolase